MGATDNFPITAPQGLVYGMEENVLSGVLESIADSGRVFGRRKRADQRAWRATYRLTTEQLRQLRDFYNRFRGASQYFIWTRPGWFTNSGALSDRVFAVHWAAAPAVVAQHHENYDVEISLIEAVGVSLASYPDPAAGHPSHFQEETAGFVVGGVWTQASHSNAHGGAEKTNPNTNTTDRFRFVYSGYGFRLWTRKAGDRERSDFGGAVAVPVEDDVPVLRRMIWLQRSRVRTPTAASPSSRSSHRCRGNTRHIARRNRSRARKQTRFPNRRRAAAL